MVRFDEVSLMFPGQLAEPPRGCMSAGLCYRVWVETFVSPWQSWVLWW